MKQVSKLTVGSLFAGIGGFDLGLERTGGFEVKWQVEIDPYCQRVLAKHWPNVQRYGDIREVRDAEPVDVICGGFPCQSVSMAGKREGQDDERWLWPEFFRVLCLLRPRYALIENTAGLASLGMPDVLRDLASVGYESEWDVIPAAAVGAPHLRERIWILAYPASLKRQHGRNGRGYAKDVLPEGAGGNQTQRREDWELIELVPGVCLREAADWWRTQSAVARSANGLSDWMDRNHAIGNAIVPQIAEWIGNRILEAEALDKRGAAT